MKKRFLLVTAIFVIGYMRFSPISIPVALEKKTIEYENAESVADAMPEIRVMTYNIHRGINKDSKLDLDSVAEVIKSSGAEIIALQEVERFSVRTVFQDQIEYIADKLSMQYAYGKSINILNGQYGNAVLSKFPIEEYEVSILPSNGERRTILRAGLNVYGNRISFCSTHLGLDQKERDMQVEEILRLAADDRNFIIAGDFNSKGDKLGAITGKYIDCAGFEDNYDKNTFEGEELSERIDYIFVSEDFRVKTYDVLESDASDHYPVAVTLEPVN
ncbi:MAG: endonuclease/exonuclease/phosphatase family protein [Clostridiaceae bacterium]|jgi:endonuclease/exonuclease/phosphatase family metal-dependent hydrolase|nr:endonuclease/exonuclease/phosphatase family protein [Clostridiaceae bacterium]